MMTSIIMNEEKKQLEPGTLEWDIERARGFVVAILMDEAREGKITADQMREIARETLQVTSQIKSTEQIKQTLLALGQKYPILDPAHVKQIVHEEDEMRARAASEVAELLKQGKLEEAGMLAHKYTSQT